MITGIVVVSYHNAENTQKFVTNQLSRLTDDYRTVIVAVDADEIYGKILAEKCGLLYIKSPNQVTVNSHGWCISIKENLGYARGNNLGVEILKKSGIEFEYYLFSNDDIEILDSDILARLSRALKQNNSIAGVGPRIIGLDGKDQSPHRKYISPQRQIGWKLFPFLRKKRTRNSIYSDNNVETISESSKYQTNKTYSITAVEQAKKNVPPTNGQCYWVSGAFLMVKADKFNAVNGFDHRTFLYFEEAILSERFLKKGWYFYYEPSATVIHYEGGSTTIKSTIRNAIEKESRMLYYKEYKHVNRFILWLYNWLERI